MPVDRNLDLELRGRERHAIYRRLGLGILCVVVAAALINVFGQGSTQTVAAAKKANLTIEAPSRLRGGLLFQARFEIEAKRRIQHPALVLSHGWLDSMTMNALVPTPLSESTGPYGLSMTFDPLSPGQTMVVWTDWQVNPTTNLGRRSETVTLFDGSTRIASADRTLTVFP